MSTASQPDVNRTNNSGLLLGLFLSLLTAAILSFAVPHFREVLAAFGADLPWFTRAVLRGYLITWLLPAAALAVWLGWKNAVQRRDIVLATGLFSAVVLLPLSIGALYLPIFKLAATA